MGRFFLLFDRDFCIMKKTLFISIILFLQFITFAYADEQGEAAFNTGVKYFKQKKYNSALKYFKQASAKGMKKSTLLFNLGITQYKLKQYQQATTSFKRLSKDRKFQQIAFYNLGLISQARKQKKPAIFWYKKSIKSNSNPKITQLAEIKLDRLLNRKKASTNSSSISVAAGYDSNITNSASNSPSNRSDNYTEIFAYTTIPLNNKMNFKGSLYSLNFSKNSSENFMLLNAGIDYMYQLTNWKLIPEIGLYNSTLNSTAFQQTLDLKIRANRKLKNNATLLLKYRYSNISSQNTTYNYLQGSRHQLRADYKTKIKAAKLRLRYQLEVNDRQNLTTANYSPTRHTFRARLQHSLKNKWKLTEEVEYRNSLYGAAAGVTRNDNRLRLLFVASKNFSRQWRGGVRYSYTSNKSNVTSENYNRNKFLIFANLDF